MSKKKIEPTDAMVDDLADYLGRLGLLAGHPGVTRWPPRVDTMDTRRIVSAVLSHPDARGLFTGEDDRPWEPLNGRPLRAGYEVRQDYFGVTTTAVVGRVSKFGDPMTAEGTFIGSLHWGTWYVRRAAQELPTEPGAVIVPADGREYIEATVRGETCLTREAIRSRGGGWYAAWRFGELQGGVVLPREITPGTWKVADQ